MYHLWLEAPHTLVLQVIGALTEKAVLDLMETTREYVSRSEEALVVLIDLSRAQAVPLHVRLHLVTLMRMPHVMALALWGGSKTVELMATVALKAAGALDRACFFATEAEARVWLSEEIKAYSQD
ncbi:MAG: hypothetical protein GYB65_16450 [Chloroflexi bacterium]|nr:hypothetical protein [Chloroflexota bacterium]